MSIHSNDIRTYGYVLRRTNYGEADRILNIITPKGKISAIAKGVRKEKSKLAGGIEMFTLTDYNVHTNKNGLGVITSAKMLRHYGEIIKDLDKVELAAMILKKTSRVAQNLDNPECYNIVDQGLKALNDGKNLNIVEAWCLLNLKKAAGEEINLYRNINGEKLTPEKQYEWDVTEMSFSENEQGRFGADEIKVLRLILNNNLDLIWKIKLDVAKIDLVLWLARVVV